MATKYKDFIGEWIAKMEADDDKEVAQALAAQPKPIPVVQSKPETHKCMACDGPADQSELCNKCWPA